MAVTDATQILLHHIHGVRSAFREAGGSVKATYDLLTGTIPDIAGMPWNTFKARLPVVLTVWEAGLAHQVDKVRDLEQVIDTLREELAAAKLDMGKIQSQVLTETEVPKTLLGWSINRHKRGYWRAFRKVKGKCRCVYIGMKFDPVAAQEKLVAANAKLEGGNHER